MAGILTATRKTAIVQGKINLKGLARLIELSKRAPDPIISEIIILGTQVSIIDPAHLKTDYFTQAWLNVEVSIQNPMHNMTFEHANKVITVDKTVNII